MSIYVAIGNIKRNTHIENCRFTNCGESAVRVEDADDVHISNCHVNLYAITTAARVGIQFLDADYCSIVDSTIIGAGDNEVGEMGIIAITGTRFLIIGNCHVINSNSDAISINGSSYVTVTGCMVEDGADVGYYAGNGSQFVTFVGCVSNNTGNMGMLIAAEDGTTTKHIHCNGCIFDAPVADEACNIISAGTGVLEGVVMMSCTYSNAPTGEFGLEIEDGGTNHISDISSIYESNAAGNYDATGTGADVVQTDPKEL